MTGRKLSTLPTPSKMPFTTSPRSTGFTFAPASHAETSAVSRAIPAASRSWSPAPMSPKLR